VINSEISLACGLVLIGAVAIGWVGGSSAYRRRLANWQVAYQRQLQTIVRREAAKAAAEITKLKSEVVALKAERSALQNRLRVIELKRWVDALPRLKEPEHQTPASDDGFPDTQPFERRA